MTLRAELGISVPGLPPSHGIGVLLRISEFAEALASRGLGWLQQCGMTTCGSWIAESLRRWVCVQYV